MQKISLLVENRFFKKNKIYTPYLEWNQSVLPIKVFLNNEEANLKCNLLQLNTAKTICIEHFCKKPSDIFLVDDTNVFCAQENILSLKDWNYKSINSILNLNSNNKDILASFMNIKFYEVIEVELDQTPVNLNRKLLNSSSNRFVNI